ncbi:MAG: transcriptional repressor [Planctomycetes bacterium]|nr:transcriptional repressor [Planctomycetota bacterium]MCC7173191.1 transcriptional repressor [Planctomycetota bacterium]
MTRRDRNVDAGKVDELFERFLRENSLKHTAQRLKIVKRAFSMPKHFAAEDLYLVLRREKTYVSKATVYRTLKLLVDAHFLDELEIGARKAKFYEPVHGREHHDHMICLRCGDILEFSDDEIETKQQEAATRHKFRLLSHSLKMFGLCKECEE